MTSISREVFTKPEETFGVASNLCWLAYFGNAELLSDKVDMPSGSLPLACPPHAQHTVESDEAVKES